MAYSPYAELNQLTGFLMPVYASSGVESRARELARRFDRAYQFLTTTLDIRLEVQLAFLSARDWPDYTQSPYYGVTLYDYPQRTVATGTEPTTFWRPALDLIRTYTPEQLEQLKAVYGSTSGEIDITSHVDLWIIHDLGHACHLHHAYWFPRKWLMEFFASLCLYTYVAMNEPELMPVAETFLRVMGDLPGHLFPHRTFQEFETRYTLMPVENYLWYGGRFMQQVAELYARMGVEALPQVWQMFVIENVHDVSDQELEHILRAGAPDIGQVLSTFKL